VRGESPGKGLGATFTVTLPSPTRRAGAELRADDRDADRPVRALPPILRGVRVLVVDDDVESLEISATMLREAGAEVRTASSAFVASDLAGAWSPDVVLTDLAMPGEDGFMLLRAMRTAFARRRAHVPVIAVTAYGTADTRVRAIRAGFDRCLTKPVDPFELTRAVAEAARRAS
jgi:CheY-like chemotaxis protein